MYDKLSNNVHNKLPFSLTILPEIYFVDLWFSVSFENKFFFTSLENTFWLFSVHAVVH